ncbi:hypothetical protein ALQ78_101773 [Pseudomonas syringae pv. aptata]|nr:Unknown protein sequence [Pseudomonas syringae pv. syringae]RMM47130.1 hypothetical protein ALQ78_101773 [Pseudomonas syringae pv. aptata]RMS26223.1 hypothetical protein ALP69_102251 [Pseudomonas syringae pv. aceris]RMS66839.1 hypothetical protein ALP62_102721 [Pseudomonas syringae pv. aceris]
MSMPLFHHFTRHVMFAQLQRILNEYKAFSRFSGAGSTGLTTHFEHYSGR